jgi:hypothetical protein
MAGIVLPIADPTIYIDLDLLISRPSSLPGSENTGRSIISLGFLVRPILKVGKGF